MQFFNLRKRVKDIYHLEMTNMNAEFNEKITEIFGEKKLPKTLAVAVSGGSDSMALVMLLREFCEQKKIRLVALTVDHKMREGSSEEALKVSKILAKKKIVHEILAIDVKKLPQKNIEGALREMRYEMLLGYCKKHKISHLFLGHIIGDVAENFLIRLFRGSGLDGLSTIAEVSEVNKIKLVRPLLNFEKADLQKYLSTKKIEWFEDESNLDEKFLRNKIRRFFSEFDERDLIHKRIKNASDEIAKMRDLFDSMMLSEAAQILEFKANEFFLIHHQKLCKLDEKFALKILSLVAMEVSGKNYKPRLKDLKSFYEYLLENSKIKPRNFYGCEVVQYDEERLLIRAQKPRGKFELRTVLKSFF